MNPDGADNRDAEILEWIEKIQSAIRQKEWKDVERISLFIMNTHQNHPEAMMYLGIARAAQGYEPEGENLILASLTLNPKNKEAYYNLGLIVLNQGRCLFAVDAFQHGLNLDPTNHALFFQLGCALERLCRNEEALDAFRKAQLHSPEEDGLDFRRESSAAIERLESQS